MIAKLNNVRRRGDFLEAIFNVPMHRNAYKQMIGTEVVYGRHKRELLGRIKIRFPHLNMEGVTVE